VLTDVFKSLESEFVTKKETNQNSLVFEIDAITNLSVESDAAKVQKMLYNLIDNALKFTKNGRVVVSASIHDEQGEKRLVCRVSDEGIGISDNHIGSMFDVFTQQDMSSTRAYEGIGLGLATSYNYAVFMGGSLSAENNADKGCTFTLSIPVDIRSTS
jgi:signal transduction histidine kinase